MKRIAIAGATGFVGRRLAATCLDEGIGVTGVSRGGGADVGGIDRWQTPDAMNFHDCDAVVNLAGEPIDRRWSPARKQAFRDSRVDFTLRVVDAIAAAPADSRPQVLVNASAVGIYGDRGDESLDEQAASGGGFLAELCADWERAAHAAEAHGVRVVTVRIGLVLGRDGRGWLRLRRLFRAGLGGRLGSGRQWMPWIHLDDLTAAILHALRCEALRGPANAAAPGCVRNAGFTRELASVLGRPAVFPAPAFALRLVLGEFASVLLASQKVVPAALEASGFRFLHAELSGALRDLNETRG